MVRFYGTVAWLLNSLGVALLVVALFLAPEGGVSGQTGEGGGSGFFLACEPTCAHPIGGCTSTIKPICELRGIACETSPVNVCDGCSCQWDDDADTCICKLVGT